MCCVELKWMKWLVFTPKSTNGRILPFRTWNVAWNKSGFDKKEYDNYWLNKVNSYDLFSQFRLGKVPKYTFIHTKKNIETTQMAIEVQRKLHELH